MSPIKLTLFLVVVPILAGLVHLYLWRRLVRDAGWSPRATKVLTVLLVVLAILVPATIVAARFAPRAFLTTALAWPGFLWTGAHFLLFSVIVAAEFPLAAAKTRERFRRARSSERGVVDGPADPSRRRFFSRAVAGAAGAVAIPATITGVAGAEAAPRVERVTVRLPRLPPEFDGYRIVHISDVHVGPMIGKGHVDRIVALANAESPDLVAITGDLVDGPVDVLGADVAPLGNLRAKDGVCFVTGNHEFYSGVPGWLAYLPTIGVRPLANERTEVRRGGAAIDVAGIHDASGGGFGFAPDIDRAMAGREKSRVVVLLAHQPKQIDDAQRHAVDLQLSGHTHGGQIFPFGILVSLVQPVVAGLEKLGGTWIYVSRGAGYWGPPMRVACPSEIAVVELRRG